MKNNSINFKQERDFGDLFNATFNFISQEFKRLATAILYFVVPFLILSAIATTIYSVKAQELTRAMTQAGTSDPFAAFSVMGSLFAYVGGMMVLIVLASAMMMCTVYSYIKLYIQGGDDPFTINDVWISVMKNFWRMLGASIIVGLVVMVGFAFCIIPGIYLGIGLSIIFCIMMFEEMNFSNAFSRSLKLINTNWWQVFGVMIITTIIVYILSILFSIPSMVMGFKSLFFNLKRGQVPNFEFSTSFYVVNSITQLVTQLFTVIPVVITAFIYYSFVEKVEKPSLAEKIDQIGNNE